MTSIRGSLALGVVMVALGGAGANAADMHEGSVKDGYIPAPEVVAAPSSSTWYLRMDGAYSSYDDPIMVEDHIYDLTDTSIDGAWAIGFGVGRHIGRGFRFDVTYDYRFEADASGVLLNHNAALDGKREFGIKSHLLMGNLYYDFNQGGRFSPYLGVGLGWVRHKTTDGSVVDTCGCTGTIEGESNDSVAAAFMAGVTFNLTAGRDQAVYGGSTKDAPVMVSSNRGLLLDVGYRFLYLGDAKTGPVTGDFGGGNVEVSEDPTIENIHAHEIRFGLRYNLN